MADQCAIRVMRELKQLEESDQLAMSVSYRESNIREIKALILGPPGTPYGFGFYQFKISIPADYPSKPPEVLLTTTNGGQTRFGPNLYANGKVCLSILGTWQGERGEQWSPAQGLESILLSIQSLLSPNPYLNEPGFENADEARNKDEIELYKAKIYHENIRLAIIEPLEEALGLNAPIIGDTTVRMPESQARTNDGDHADRRGIVGDAESLHGPFADYCKKRFLWYLALYTQTVETFVKRGAAWHRRQFHRVSFETSGNQMAGTFDFPDLQRRLNILEDKIMEETYAWPNEGLKLAKEEAPIAVNLRGQHEQIVAQLGRRNGSMIDLGMVDDNPFLWRMTYFGCPATLFDGGVLPIKIYISPRHPIEQPRVFVETPIFHVRVSTKKVLIYLPARAEEMWHHIDGIISSLEEEFPPFNPLMAVNAEAAKLCWGSKDDKKQYTRKLRRSIEATVECL